MKIARRQFLHLAGAATTFVASATVMQAQQSPKIGVLPPRSARERLEEALARITDPKGEGARACLTVYSQASHNAAVARASAGIAVGLLDGAIISVALR